MRLEIKFRCLCMETRTLDDQCFRQWTRLTDSRTNEHELSISHMKFRISNSECIIKWFTSIIYFMNLLLQPMTLDREDPAARRRVVAEVACRVKSRLWPPLGFFPEGTTGAGNRLMTFKSGAFLPGVPVQPAIIRVPNHIVWTWGSSSQ